MSAQGKWVEFVEVKEKGISPTNKDLKHGKIVSIGDEVTLKLKKGDIISASMIKGLQDLLEGETRHFVPQDAIIKKL